MDQDSLEQVYNIRTTHAIDPDPVPHARTQQSSSKGPGGGKGDQILAALPTIKLTPGKAKQESLGLSRSLVWIQEKNFEDKFEVVKVIGYARMIYSEYILASCIQAFARKKMLSLFS